MPITNPKWFSKICSHYPSCLHITVIIIEMIHPLFPCHVSIIPLLIFPSINSHTLGLSSWCANCLFGPTFSACAICGAIFGPNATNLVIQIIFSTTINTGLFSATHCRYYHLFVVPQQLTCCLAVADWVGALLHPLSSICTPLIEEAVSKILTPFDPIKGAGFSSLGYFADFIFLALDLVHLQWFMIKDIDSAINVLLWSSCWEDGCRLQVALPARVFVTCDPSSNPVFQNLLNRFQKAGDPYVVGDFIQLFELR